MSLMISLIVLCLVLVGAVLLFTFGLAFGIIGFVGSLILSIAGFALKLTGKTILAVVAIFLLICWLL